jgi:hypothetical protein
MITIEVDFNHADGSGRLLLADLAAHDRTPFGDIAASGERIIFIDGQEFVEGRLIEDPQRGWVAAVDWDSQDTIRAFPSDRTTLLRTAT